MITATIEFEQPASLLPADAMTRRGIAAALVEHPGKWVLLGAWLKAGSSRQMAYAIRQGSAGWQMFGSGFEAKAVTVVGEHRIYVRYVGAR